jgi:hypothetical protein
MTPEEAIAEAITVRNHLRGALEFLELAASRLEQSDPYAQGSISRCVITATNATKLAIRDLIAPDEFADDYEDDRES